MIDALTAALDWSPAQALLVAVMVFVAYTVVGMTGFGAMLVGGSVIAQQFPLRFVIPFHSLLDVTTSVFIGRKLLHEGDRHELRLLVPMMLIGMTIGLTLLIKLPTRTAQLLLGVFVVTYATLSLAGRMPAVRLPRWTAVPLGIAGGVFSALFGTGGPIYVMYLSRRIDDVTVVRSTVAVLITLAAFVRVAMFAVSGLLSAPSLWVAVLFGMPFMLAGLFLGRRLHHRLPVERVRKVIYVLLLASGVGLLVRALE